MLRYLKFLNEKKIEMIDESIIFFSPSLRKQLKKIDNKISKDLLSIEATDIKPDVTFVDFDKVGYLSFITMKNADRLIAKSTPAIPSFSNIVSAPHIIGTNPAKDFADSIWSLDISAGGESTGITKKSRNPIKIGRLIKQISPDKFSDKEIEEFVNEFKSSLENSKEKILIVEGEQIEFWYDSENYFELSGTLGNSCMRNKSGIFDIYNNNPEVCRMVCLIEDDKLKARALLWKVKENKMGFEYFMDRQYTIVDSDINKMRNYAIENGWAYKTYNNHYSLSSVTYKDKIEDILLNVQVKPFNEKTTLKYDYEKYPYMDTFRIFDQKNGILYNTGETSDYKGCYLLEDTDGEFEEIEDKLYSDYYDVDIPTDQAIWSDPLSTWIRRHDCVEVSRGSNGNIGVYPSDYESICFCDITNEYFHECDCVYSEEEQTHILDTDCISVVHEIYKDHPYFCGECNNDQYYVYKNGSSYISYTDISNTYWFKTISSDKSWDEHKGILKSILIKNMKDEWIPEKFSVSTNQVEENLRLSILDGMCLGYECDESLKEFLDEWEYNNSIKELYPKLISIYEDIIEKLKDKIEDSNKSLKLIKERLIEIKDRIYLKS